MLLPPSSPIVYPPSSSPPALPTARKRSIPAEEREAKRRLLIRGNPLSQRDPNRQDGGDIWADWQPPELPESTLSKSQLKGPFVDKEDGENDSRTPALSTNDENGHTKDVQSVLPAAVINSTAKRTEAKSCSGRSFQLKEKQKAVRVSFQQMAEGRSSTDPKKATRCFYGVEIHSLLDRAAAASNAAVTDTKASSVVPLPMTQAVPTEFATSRPTLMWTEKYRAKKFTDLVGDERTHRDVLRWVKHWDPLVFPGSSRLTTRVKSVGDTTEDKAHCKILLLTGPPGLGKTTLAHVCARQAGYEVVEINASDERSRDIVKGKIRDLVGTENVRGVKTKTTNGTVRRAGRPVCVVIDEVDGVVGGTGGGGGGEGGFVKALIDLVALDKKNSEQCGKGPGQQPFKKTRKGDRFRLLRPMILICNDVYHPALRPLRSSGIAEIIHVRKPPMDKVTARLKFVFEKEGIVCDSDGIRRLCEATWGSSSSRENRSTMLGTGEGDIRGLLVVGEWVAARIRAHEVVSATQSIRLTRQWIQQHLLKDLSHNGSAARSLGRGGAREVMERIFQDNAGFPKESNHVAAQGGIKTKIGVSFGVSEAGRRVAVARLRDLVETSGECDRIVTECFASYATFPFQDDTLLTKPAAAYDWLQFHDRLSAKVYSGQDWELMPYMSQASLGFHLLFASAPKRSWTTDLARSEEDGEKEPVPFTGSRADYEASETQKQNKAVLQSFQSHMSPSLQRSFRSIEDITTGLLPCLIKILTPDVKPVIVGGSGEQRGIVSVRKGGERRMIERAVGVMPDVGVSFERSRIGQVPERSRDYVYRMDPPVDALTTFETSACTGLASSTTRYAICQALDQEYQKSVAGQRASMGQDGTGAGSNTPPNRTADIPRSGASNSVLGKANGLINAPKRDFFGRVVKDDEHGLDEANGQRRSSNPGNRAQGKKEDRQIFVSFHEGYSNAVRKPITLDDLMRGL
ncbi:MAG: hypothetical protein Q9169_004135 [Polycauliona sp. 2 TL-2023]